jgi:hypothetical protein
MREIRQSGSEGGEAGYLTGLPYPYQASSVNGYHRPNVVAESVGEVI